MRYYKIIDNGVLFAIGTGYGGEEITEEEYNELLTEIQQKVDYTNKLYNEEIELTDIPEDWRGEIINRVQDRIAAEVEAQAEEVSADEIKEALEAIL